MDIADWVAAIAAVLAFVFAVITWVLQSQTKKAKQDAEDARDAAKKSAESLEGMAREMKKLADAARGPVLEATYGNNTLTFRTGESEDLQIVGMDLVQFHMGRVALPLTVPAKSMTPVPVMEAMNHRVPNQFKVTLSDGRDVLVGVQRLR